MFGGFSLILHLLKSMSSSRNSASGVFIKEETGSEKGRHLSRFTELESDGPQVHTRGFQVPALLSPVTDKETEA